MARSKRRQAKKLGGQDTVAPARQAILNAAFNRTDLPQNHLAAFLEEGGLLSMTNCSPGEDGCAWNERSPLVAMSWGERASIEDLIALGLPDPNDPLYGILARPEGAEKMRNQPYLLNRYDRGHHLICENGYLSVDFDQKGRAKTYSSPCWWPDTFEAFKVDGLGTDEGWGPRLFEFLFNTRTREVWHIVMPQ